jgi:hypothetical protein
MNVTRGIEFRNKRYAAALGSLLLATAMLITACGTTTSSTTSSGNGNSSNGNSNGGNSSGTRVIYLYPAQGYVEVFDLNIDNSGNVAGSLYDVYNCGNGQSGTAPAPIGITGTAPTDSTLDLEIGDSGDLQGQVVNQGLDLTNSSGGALELELITASNSVDGAVAQQPPVYSISGYTCADLPTTNEP